MLHIQRSSSSFEDSGYADFNIRNVPQKFPPAKIALNTSSIIIIISSSGGPIIDIFATWTLKEMDNDVWLVAPLARWLGGEEKNSAARTHVATAGKQKTTALSCAKQ
jgi:hypothetical protein